MSVISMFEAVNRNHVLAQRVPARSVMRKVERTIVNFHFPIIWCDFQFITPVRTAQTIRELPRLFKYQHRLYINKSTPPKMADLETFHQLPLTIDPSTKALSSSNASLRPEIDDLNKLHRLLLSLDTPSQIPAPPAPVNPKRSVNINKLRESGNASYKKGAYADAIRVYDLAIRMASERPAWEASGLVRDELSALYNNRAQAYMSQQLWVEGAVDAEVSVEMKKVGNVKGWWRRGQCLKEMGRLEEAREWVRQGLEFERAGPEKGGLGELEGLAREVERALAKA